MPRPPYPIVTTIRGTGVSEPEFTILKLLPPPGRRVLAGTLQEQVPHMSYAVTYRWLLILKKKGLVDREVQWEMVQRTKSKRIYWGSRIQKSELEDTSV